MHFLKFPCTEFPVLLSLIHVCLLVIWIFNIFSLFVLWNFGSVAKHLRFMFWKGLTEIRLLCHMRYYCLYISINISNTVIPRILFLWSWAISEVMMLVSGSTHFVFGRWSHNIEFLANAPASVLVFNDLIKGNKHFCLNSFYFLRQISAKSNNTNNKYYSQVQLMSLASLSGSICVVCLHTDSFKPNSITPNANSNETFPLRAV